MLRPPPPSAPITRPLPRRDKTIARKPPSEPPADPLPKPALRSRATPRAQRPTAALPTTAPPKPGTPRKKAAAAGPVAANAVAAAREAAAVARLDQLQALIAGSLEDDKAEDVVSIDLAGRAAFADRMVLATGLADRQIAAMATHLEEKLHAAGVRRVQVEGAAGSDWVLIDAGDIVVHLFKPDARRLYALERMWGAELDEAPAAGDG